MRPANIGAPPPQDPSPPFRAEREGPSTQRWEGEVGTGERSGIPHLIPALSAPEGGEGERARTGRRWLFVVPAVVFALMAAGFYYGLQIDSNTLPSALIDKPAPRFELPRQLRVDAMRFRKEDHAACAAIESLHHEDGCLCMLRDDIEERRLIRIVGALHDEMRRLVDEDQSVIFVENFYCCK